MSNFREVSFNNPAYFTMPQSFGNNPLTTTNQFDHRISPENRYSPNNFPQISRSSLPIMNPFQFMPQQTLLMWSNYLRSIALNKGSSIPFNCFNVFSAMPLNNNLLKMLSPMTANSSHLSSIENGQPRMPMSKSKDVSGRANCCGCVKCVKFN